MNIKQIIIEKLKTVVNADVEINVSIPDNSLHGDYTTNIAMQLAKVEKKSPIEIAKRIVEELKDIEGVSKIEFIARIHKFLDIERRTTSEPNKYK